MSVLELEQVCVAEGVELPLEYVTKVAAILAQRRKGKTYTAAVIAEELWRLRMPWVALDPTGAWWGLRSSADGESAGLPVVVIGGRHGDLPLEPGSGRFIADLVIDHPGWYVLDISTLGGRPAEREFSTEFAERLMQRKQDGADFPMHLFIDEADMFLPQEKETRGDVALLAAYSAIVRRGGLAGLGCTLISQRPALVNKNALTQLDLLILLRLVAGNDQDAVYKNYLSRALSKPRAQEVMDTLASLKVGEAWFLEPGADPMLLKREHVYARQTFNSSATPKPGEKRIEPKVLADVDLDALRVQMGEAIERAKADDPAELRLRLRDAEERARSAERTLVDAQRDRNDADLATAIADAEERVRDACRERDEARAAVRVVGQFTPEALEDARLLAVGIEALLMDTTALAERAARVAAAVDDAPAPSDLPPVRVAPAAPRPETTVVDHRSAAGIVADANRDRLVRERERDEPPHEGLSAVQQRILDSLAWWRAAGVEYPTRLQVAVMVGYGNAKSRGFVDPLYGLNSSGYTRSEGGTIELTADGARAARAPSTRPSEDEYQARILSLIPSGSANILRELIAEGGRPIEREELAARVGYTNPKSRGFVDPLYRLRSLGFAEYQTGAVRATELCWIR